MTTEEIIKRLRPIVDEWPLGNLVWHRAHGKRGVIVGYAVSADGGPLLRVDYGDNGFPAELPICMSGTKVNDGTDGDEWKDGGKESSV